MSELIANTGIQYIEIHLNLEEGKNLMGNKHFGETQSNNDSGGEEIDFSVPYYWEEQDLYLDIERLNAEAVDKHGNVIPNEIKKEFVHEIQKEEIYSVRGKEAIDIYAGHWVPIPYFRLRNDSSNPFHQGPQDWCRMWIGEAEEATKKENNCTHTLVLAFDTATTIEQNRYNKPTDKDATAVGNERFKCVTTERYFRSFYTREDIVEWLFNIYEISPSRKTGHFRNIATYLTLIDTLEKMNAFPEIALLKGENIIETGLVLDIGNSRTCGLVVETSNPKSSTSFDFTSARKLSVRDLSNPNKTYCEPFEMQVAFAQEKFGNEAANLIDDSFNWPSLVRVGPEAIRLTSIFESENSQASLSSPKRYLWDHEESTMPWIKVDKDSLMGYTTALSVKESALFGIAEHITSKGKVIRKTSQVLQASESNFSRSSLMTFSLFELICQALSQINNVEFRKDAGNSSFKRRLKQIVITCPTAMTYKEQSYLKKSLEDAVFLAQKYYDTELLAENVEIYPSSVGFSFDEEEERVWKYDEATCSQIAFLYGELVDKFKGNHELFFKYKGKKRKGSLEENKESVTIASIDIGGGTTDLMICNYQPDSESEIPYIKPKPLFWEGFNIAGDDIIKRIIEYVILPEIEKNIRELGGINIEEGMNYLFGPNLGNQSATHRIFRKQFANQVANCCAYAALNHVTNSEHVNAKKTIGDIFKDFSKPKNNLIPYIEKTIKTQCGLEEFNFYDILIDFDTLKINYAISDILKPVVEQMTKLVSVFDCDILLLTGKPSNLPVIRDLFSKTMVVSPDKIISLGDYKIGTWFPFANSVGDVKDPKTTVIVGALISLLSSINRLSDFRIDLTELNNIDSTANIIGVMDNNYASIPNDKVIFDENSMEGEFKFYGAPITIGMRQLASEDWISSPLYVFDFSNDELREKISKEEFEYPFTITINRDGENKEELLIEDIVVTDKNGEEVESKGYFKLHFKTLSNDYGYWKDTGSFLLNIIKK